MPITLRKRSRDAQKRPANVDAQVNAEKSDEPATKRARAAKKSTNPPPPQSASQTSDGGLDGEDISVVDVYNQQFSLCAIAMVDNDEFHNDSAFLLLGMWSWRIWNMDCIRKLQKAGEKDDYITEWVSGRAVIGARGIGKGNSFAIAVDDDVGWDRVERFVCEWMKKGRKDINVRLTMKWKKIKESNGSKDSDDENVPKSKRMVSFICYTNN
jgi:hypothetical protein